MIKQYVFNTALGMGLELSNVSLAEGRFLGRRDTHSLMLSSSGCSFSTILYQTDLEQLDKGVECDRLRDEVRHTLSRLQLMLET